MNLGNIYLRKNAAPTIAQYEKALSILGSDAKVMNNLGSAYMQLSNYPRAESYYKRPPYHSIRNIQMFIEIWPTANAGKI